MVRIRGMSDSNIGDLDLNLLPALDMLLRERNVTRAAGKMGLSQSAMSHKLRHLRAHFDDPLLVASSGGLVPTERAEALAGPLSLALAELSSAIRQREPFDPGTSTRRFVVASSDYGELAVLPQLMHQLATIAPHVEVVFKTPSDNLGVLLTAGDVDVTISPHVAQAAGMQQRRVQSEGFVTIARADHPGIGRRLSLRRFTQLPHLLVTPSGGTTGIVDVMLARKQLTRYVALRIPHFTGAAFIVAASDLIWTAPVALARVAQRYVALSTYKPPLELPAVDSYMVWHQRFQHDPGHRWLRELIVATITQLESDPEHDGGPR